MLYTPHHILSGDQNKKEIDVACMVDTKGAYRALVRRPDGKRPIRGPRHRLENNIKMNLQ